MTDWIKNNTDMIVTIVNVLIAFTNVIWSIFAYKKTSKHNSLKTLILDYNIKYLYEYFDNVEKSVEPLKSRKSTDKVKMKVINELVQHSRNFQQKFIDLFFSVNQSLYKELNEDSESLIDSLSSSIADEGINLYNEAKYDELVKSKISESKSKMILKLINNCK